MSELLTRLDYHRAIAGLHFDEHIWYSFEQVNLGDERMIPLVNFVRSLAHVSLGAIRNPPIRQGDWDAKTVLTQSEIREDSITMLAQAHRYKDRIDNGHKLSLEELFVLKHVGSMAQMVVSRNPETVQQEIDDRKKEAAQKREGLVPVMEFAGSLYRDFITLAMQPASKTIPHTPPRFK